KVGRYGPATSHSSLSQPCFSPSNSPLVTRFAPLPTHPRHSPLVSPLVTQTRPSLLPSMLCHLLFLLQAAQQPPKKPVREVPDPGIIATDQRVTPAGVQSVFDGRVGGVKFGKVPGELWVAVPGAAYRLAWRDNRVVASSKFDGRPGVYGVALDPATGRALVSTVGRLPADLAIKRTPGGPPLPRAKSFIQLFTYAADGPVPRGNGGGDSASVVSSSVALGDYLAGATAV